MRATRTFTDEKKKLRKNGEEWLITFTDTETYIPKVSEEVCVARVFFITSIVDFFQNSCCYVCLFKA